MKTLFKIFIASVILVTASSCSKDDNGGGITQQASNNLKSGTWKVELFVDDGMDHTADFSSFIFTFSNGAVVTATNSALTATGTWSVTTDNDTPKLNLSFGSPALFVDLSEDWEILTVTNNTVALHHDGGGGMDMLTFKKN